MQVSFTPCFASISTVTVVGPLEHNTRSTGGMETLYMNPELENMFDCNFSLVVYFPVRGGGGDQTVWIYI